MQVADDPLFFPLLQFFLIDEVMLALAATEEQVCWSQLLTCRILGASKLSTFQGP